MNSEAIKQRVQEKEVKNFKYLEVGEDYIEREQGISLLFAEQRLDLIWYRPGLVRFLLDSREDFSLDASTPAIIAEAGQVDLKYHITEEEIKVIGPEVAVNIKLEPFAIFVLDQDGNLLQADLPGQSFGSYRQEVKLKKILKPEERIYGLGEKTGFLDKRGRSYEMWNTDTFEPHVPSTDPMYISVPFYLVFTGENSYGIYHDNSYRTTFDLGHSDPDEVVFSAAGGRIDYYLMAGKNPAQVVTKYTWLTGRTELPPLWALGHHQSRYSYYPDEAVTQLGEKFRELSIPCDAIHLDIHYMDGYRVFSWDQDRFPQPEKLLGDLQEQGFKTIAIVDPGVKKDPEYDVYRSGQQKDYFCRYLDGRLYTGDVWPGESVFPDFTRANVREWWQDLHKSMIEQGIKGFWNDMNEPAVFNKAGTMDEAVEHKNDGDPGPHKRFHNLYGLHEAQATNQALKNYLQERPFILSRAAFAGMQRYAAVWTGDNRSFWEHIELSIPMIINMGLSGLAFAGCDIGGFTGDSTGELLARWYQLGAFMPFFRNHTTIGSRSQEPWAFGEPYTSINRDSIEMRYHILPQLYSLFYQQKQQGLPIWRPLFFYYPEDPKTYNLNDQLLFGENILLAPVVRPDTTERSVYLPAGGWYDYWTGEFYPGGQTYVVDAPLDKMPIFVKANTGYLTMEPVQYIEGGFKDLTLNIYPGADKSSWTGQIYEDDGLSFNYQDGGYNLTWYELECSADSITLDLEVEVSGYASEVDGLQVNFATISRKPQTLFWQGQEVPEKDYYYEENRLIISLPYQKTGQLEVVL
ncbi:MAG: TIM-barrel domain-containing protein [Bacillota bacterium]